jgi:DNA-binding NarL/FixJ family response regulator
VPIIRTVVVTLPLLFGDIIKTSLAEHFTLDVVARLDSRTEIEKQLPFFSPDLIIVGLHDGETDEIGHTLLAFVPLAKVIVLSNDGRNAYVHEMRAHRSVLIDVSPGALVDAIRRAVSGSNN